MYIVHIVHTIHIAHILHIIRNVHVVQIVHNVGASVNPEAPHTNPHLHQGSGQGIIFPFPPRTVQGTRHVFSIIENIRHIIKLCGINLLSSWQFLFTLIPSGQLSVWGSAAVCPIKHDADVQPKWSGAKKRSYKNVNTQLAGKIKGPGEN